MDNLKFYTTNISDINKLKEIYTYYINNSTATFHIGSISNSEMKEILFFDDSTYESFVMKSDSNIVGYVLLSPYKKRQAYKRSAEVTIYIDPNYIGNGIGLKAINFIEEVAKEKEIKSLLSIICGENIASIKLFEKCGYSKCGHLKNVGEKFGRILDIVIYQKEI